MLCRVSFLYHCIALGFTEILSANVNVYIMDLIFLLYSPVKIKSYSNKDKALESGK